MRVLNDRDFDGIEWEATAVSIGAYDGVHLGHRALIGEMRSRAEVIGLASVVVTFDKHPASVVRPDSAPMLLTELDQKLELLASTGIDGVYVINFDRSRSEQSPEQFVIGSLVETLRARLVVVGSDFHFGKGRAGNLNLLSEMGRSYGFGVEAVELMPGRLAPGKNGDILAEPISSTRVRELLMQGRVEAAAALLGRDHEVRGQVEHGDGRGGSELGCPTANIAIPSNIALPKDGIYAGWCRRSDGVERPIVASLGKRPTFYRDCTESLLEVHLIGFSGDLYGERLSVRFRKRLRDELRFESVEDLVTQIRVDIDNASLILGI